MANRSAITGRYISNAAAARWPHTTVIASTGGGNATAQNRSAISGRYISNAAAARWPNTSIRESGN